MSVKGKVKRCNKEIKRLQEELETYQLSNSRLREKLNSQVNDKTLENIIKFALTNQVGGLRAGIMIDAPAIDKMKDVRLIIDRNNECGGAYVIRTHW